MDSTVNIQIRYSIESTQIYTISTYTCIINKERLSESEMKLVLILLLICIILTFIKKVAQRSFLLHIYVLDGSLAMYYSNTAPFIPSPKYFSKQYPTITNVSSTPPMYNHFPHISIPPKLASLTLPRLDPMHHSHVPLVI